ncbi:hypothetical protein Trydic_g7141 [Trypoxylus dichotomus]
MGYRYKKPESNKKKLMERQDIVAWRSRHLRFINYNDGLGENRKAMVYLDETYVYKNYTVPKCCQSLKEKGVLKTDGAAQRRIMCHAGGEMGFINGAFLLLESKTRRAGGAR